VYLKVTLWQQCRQDISFHTCKKCGERDKERGNDEADGWGVGKEDMKERLQSTVIQANTEEAREVIILI
jgi:hypothetical protein